MKKFLLSWLILVSGLMSFGQTGSLRFIHISDTHIGSPNGSAEEDLRRTIADINSRTDIAFVVITGDITELGTNEELALAKKILDELKVQWHIIPGNHDSGWSESGGDSFIKTFGYDKFVFDHGGIRFIGCASGPYVRMSDGHVPRNALVWMDTILARTPLTQPLIFLNHYPLDPGLDNWYEITDRLNRFNTLAVLCGHGHVNKMMNFDSIPAFMGRSNLRAKAEVGGFNIVDIRNDSMIYTEHRPGTDYYKIWGSVDLKKGNKIVVSPKPDFNIKSGKPVWTFNSDAAFLGSPIVDEGRVYIGGSDHHFRALDAATGKEIWKFDGLDGPVVSKPVLYNDKIIFGAWDRHLYALNKNNGNLIWKWNNGSPVRNFSPAACVPVISGNTIFIVAPDHYISAIDIETGQTLWRNNDATIRESVGISEDGKIIYGKTMQDTIVAYNASREKQNAAWKMHCGFGYEHSPSVLIEKNGLVFFGTRSGVVYCIDPRKQTIEWAHKIDNSMVNTLNIIGKKKLVAATMDGKVALLNVR